MSAPQQPSFNAPAQGKSRVVAGLLNLFLGGFGIGDFYLGYTQYAIYKIVISLVLVVPTVLNLGFISTIFSLLYYAWAVVLLASGSTRRTPTAFPPSELCLCAHSVRAHNVTREARHDAGPRAFSLSRWRAPGLIRDVSGVDWLSLSVAPTLPCTGTAISAPTPLARLSHDDARSAGHPLPA